MPQPGDEVIRSASPPCDRGWGVSSDSVATWQPQLQGHPDWACQCASAGQCDAEAVRGSACQASCEDIGDHVAEGVCDQNC